MVGVGSAINPAPFNIIQPDASRRFTINDFNDIVDLIQDEVVGVRIIVCTQA